MTTTPKPEPIMQPAQPCKPRLSSTHTDRLPTPMREGADEISRLPSLMGNYRVWPDGRKEKL